jgi:hypothetical protein
MHGAGAGESDAFTRRLGTGVFAAGATVDALTGSLWQGGGSTGAFKDKELTLASTLADAIKFWEYADLGKERKNTRTQTAAPATERAQNIDASAGLDDPHEAFSGATWDGRQTRGRSRNASA